MRIKCLIKETNTSREFDVLRNLSKSVDMINKNEYMTERYKY